MIGELLHAIFGTGSWSFLDYMMLIAAIVATYVAIRGAVPFEEGTKEHLAHKLSSVSVALSLWSYGFGLIGVLLTIAAFVLSIVTMTKGLISRGVAALVLLVVVKIVGFIDTAMFVAKNV